MKIHFAEALADTTFKRYISIGITFGGFMLMITAICIFLSFKKIKRLLRKGRMAIYPSIDVMSMKYELNKNEAEMEADMTIRGENIDFSDDLDNFCTLGTPKSSLRTESKDMQGLTKTKRR